jgi:periplasmic protein TonB
VSTAEIYLDGGWTTRHVERPSMGPTLDVRPLRHRDPPLGATVIDAVTVAAPAAKPLLRKRWPYWTVALSLSVHAAVALAALVLPATPPLLLDGAMIVEIVGGEMVAGLASTGQPSSGPQSAESATPIRQLAERALPESTAAPAISQPLEMPQPVAIDKMALQARPTPEPPLLERFPEQTLPPAPQAPAPISEPAPAPPPEPVAPTPAPPTPAPPTPAPPTPRPPKLVKVQPAATAPARQGSMAAGPSVAASGAAPAASGNDQTPAGALRPAAATGGGASQGERGASLIHQPSIAYPRRAQRRGQEGVVEIRMVIGADGQPTAVSLETSSGVRDLDDAGLAAAWLYRFQPALRGGIAVSSEFVQPIEFKLHTAR